MMGQMVMGNLRITGRRQILRPLIVLCAFVSLAACSSYGPRSMNKDQLDYGQSVGNSWKNQMLTNIVKLRFVDMPVFIDVGQIVSGYSLETSVDGRVGFDDSLTGGDSAGLGASGKFTDRPTITYMPKTGNEYLRSLLEPVEPVALLSLILAGYSSEILFTWAVESVNGVHNYSVVANVAREADAEYLEFARLMQDLQDLGAVGFKVKIDPVSGNDVIFVYREMQFSDDILAKKERVGEILKLDPGHEEYRVRYAPFAESGDVLAMQTRSVLQMLVAMSGFVEVPREVASHAARGYDLSPGAFQPFRVHSGPDRPEYSFAAIRYQDYWYWIENSDLLSKRVFTLMLFLTTLTNSASNENAPVLTIPTN
jgi:hypothetical protein